MIFDLHVHSLYSDGAATPSEIVKHAKDMGFAGVAITDHDEVAGALAALRLDLEDFVVIPGTEVSSIDGHILALGVKQKISRDLSAEATVDRIHALGGVAIAAHPFDKIRKGVGDLVYSVKFDAVEVYNGHTMWMSRTPEEIMKNLEVPATGGSDAHTLSELGAVTMDFPEGCDVLEAIIKGEGKISVNISKSKILFNHLNRKLMKRRTP